MIISGLHLKTSLKGWHQRWFYVSNPSPSLRAYVGNRPSVRNSWNSLPSTEEMKQVDALLEKLKACKRDDGVNGVSMVINFLGRRAEEVLGVGVLGADLGQEGTRRARR